MSSNRRWNDWAGATFRSSKRVLPELVAEGLAASRLRFVLGSAGVVEDADFVFLCVPTPQGEDGAADLRYVEDAAREIGPLLRSGTIVINKSTVPVGSTRVVERAMQRSDVHVVSNPEFLREGTAVTDFLRPDRVVIGADDQAVGMRVASLYSSLDAPIQVTDPPSAETIKYACNAFLATKLSFINAVAAVCEAVGADVNDVVVGMGYDRRIGSEFLRPGPGWGGSCFPKDTKALIHIAETHGYDFGLLRGVVEVNNQQFDRVVDKVERAAGGNLDGKHIAAWGLTFKARTDDLRDSPALEVLSRLAERGARIRAYDPAISELSEAQYAGVDVVSDPYAAAKDADVLVLLTEWDEFRWLDFARVAEVMATPTIIDTRNLLDRQLLRQEGIAHEGIGRL
jgi:UDPglucose 6-dehydrogenase